MKEHLFVNLMMILQIGAVANYAIKADYGLSVYWAACLAINFVVTYILIK